MNALTLHHIRKAALEVKAHNPLADVFVPEEPDWQDVVNAKTEQLLAECAARKDMAELYADSFEVLLEKRAEIIHRAANTLAAVSRSWPDIEASKTELSAFGAEVLRLVTEDIHGVAVSELEKEE